MEKAELQKMLADTTNKKNQLEVMLYQLVGRELVLKELLDNYDKPKEPKKDEK
jgi:hypothetical protein